MQVFDRKVFFEFAKRAPLGNRLTQQQVNGMNAILDEWERKHSSGDIRHLAYILATVFHETGGRMVAVREGFAKSDAEARKIVAKRKYGVPDATSNGKRLGPATGHVYYGRGLVQITWKDNYDRMGKLLGVDLVNNPDLALDAQTGIDILFEGMFHGVSAKGDFTGKSLEDYFNATKDDPVGARKIINGTDKDRHIAENYHAPFLAALEKAKTAHKQADSVWPEQGEAPVDGANLLKDNTMVGTVLTAAAGGAGTFLGAITNPWAFGAFAVLAVLLAAGAYLAITGRIQIKKKAGA